MKPKFKVIKKTNIHNGFYEMNEIILRYKKFDGSWSKDLKREIFGGAQVSAVLPYDPVKKEIVLIKQFRPGTISKKIDNYLYEIPAGMIDPGEDPETTAIRECFEETDCKIKKLLPIQGYFPAPGSSESFYHIYFGETETFKGKRLTGLKTESEDILVKSFKINDVKKLLNSGQIVNGVAIIALQWFFLNIKD